MQLRHRHDRAGRTRRPDPCRIDGVKGRPRRDVGDIDPHLNQPVDRAAGRFQRRGDIIQRLLGLLLERRVYQFVPSRAIGN